MLRAALNRLLLRFLRRDPHEVERRAEHFALSSEENRLLVARLGEAFLGGYHAMLEAADCAEVASAGTRVTPHFRPFYFEGAAMGYLPRGYLGPGFGRAGAERDLLGMDPRFRYLYYVGLGFWYGFRHSRAPAKLAALAPHVAPLYYPLCFDGFGFKLGFFDDRARARAVLERGPADQRYALYQGFGRALFFVHMEDDAGFLRDKQAAPEERRQDMEFGRSLAVAFTGVDRPQGIVRHLASARGEADLASRLLGVTWALTARELNDPAYFEECIARAGQEQASLLRRLPALCREALSASKTYPEWQSRSRAAALAAYAAVTRTEGAR